MKDAKDDAADVPLDDAGAPKDVFDFDEAAAFLGVSTKTFAKVLRTENLPGRKVGREWKFARAALIAWLSAGHVRDYHDDAEGADAVGDAVAEARRPAPARAPFAERNRGGAESFTAEED